MSEARSLFNPAEGRSNHRRNWRGRRQRRGQAFSYQKPNVERNSKQQQLSENDEENIPLLTFKYIKDSIIMNYKVVPPLKISISTIHVIELCKMTIQTYNERFHLQLVDNDLISLILVTLLQIEGKEWTAKWKNHVDSEYSNEVFERVQKTKEFLKKAVCPLSTYIAQVGEVNVNEQIIVPEVIDLKYENFSDYIARLKIPHLSEQNIPDHQQVINNYLVFMNKVVNNVPKKLIADVDYENAKGTAAQLVTSRFTNDNSRIMIWSHRRVDEDDIKIGVFFRLGFGIDNCTLRSYGTRQYNCYANSFPQFISPFVNDLIYNHSGKLPTEICVTLIPSFGINCKLPISTVYVRDFCRELIDYLRIEKVTLRDSDFLTLVHVTILQIEAKVYDHETNSFVNYEKYDLTKRIFTKALYPISLYLKQIGKVKINDQTIVPELCDMNYEKIRDYVQVGDEFNSGYLEGLIKKWYSFKGRIEYKKRNIFLDVNYDTSGTNAQLVTSKLSPNEESKKLLVWSQHKVEDIHLKMGALFRYGFNLEFKNGLRSYNDRYCNTLIYRENLMDSLLSKIFSKCGEFVSDSSDTD